MRYEVPRSMPRTAEAAEAVLVRRKMRRVSVGIRGRVRRRPGGAIACVWRILGGCRLRIWSLMKLVGVSFYSEKCESGLKGGDQLD